MTLDLKAIERRAAAWVGPPEHEMFSVGTVLALLAARADLVAALLDVIEIDHHNHGEESRATKIARAALIRAGGVA